MLNVWHSSDKYVVRKRTQMKTNQWCSDVHGNWQIREEMYQPIITGVLSREHLVHLKKPTGKPNCFCLHNTKSMAFMYRICILFFFYKNTWNFSEPQLFHCLFLKFHCSLAILSLNILIKFIKKKKKECTQTDSGNLKWNADLIWNHLLNELSFA